MSKETMNGSSTVDARTTLKALMTHMSYNHYSDQIS